MKCSICAKQGHNKTRCPVEMEKRRKAWEEAAAERQRICDELRQKRVAEAEAALAARSPAEVFLDFEEQIAELKAKVAELEGEIAEADTREANLETMLAKVQAERDKLKEDERSVDDAHEERDEAVKRYEDLSSALGSLIAELAPTHGGCACCHGRGYHQPFCPVKALDAALEGA